MLHKVLTILWIQIIHKPLQLLSPLEKYALGSEYVNGPKVVLDTDTDT